MATINTDIGTIADHWKLVCLEEIAEKPKYGYTASAAEYGDTKFLRITDITEFGVSWDTVPYCECSKVDLSKYELRENDILFARIGATTGKTCIVKNAPQSVFASYLIRVRAKNCIDADYLYFFLQSSGYWNQINSSKHNNLKKGVNAAILSSLLLPLPPIEEQRKIARVLSLVQDAIAQQEKLITLTTELKKALMQKLFTEGTCNEPQKMTEIGLIPESWDVVSLGKLAKTTISGGTPSTKIDSYWNGNIPWITSKWLNEELYIVSGEKFISDEAVNKSSTKIIPANNLIVVTRVGLGKVSINKIDLAINQDLTGIIVDKNKINLEFIAYQLRTDRVKQFIDKNKRGATIKGITRSCVKEIDVLLPSPEEQKNISEIFLLLQKKKFLYQQRKKQLQDLFRTLLHQLMTAQIRVDDLNLSALNLEPQGGNE